MLLETNQKADDAALKLRAALEVPEVLAQLNHLRVSNDRSLSVGEPSVLHELLG